MISSRWNDSPNVRPRFLPHGGGDPLTLGLRKLGIGQLEVAESAFLPMEMRRDKPPGHARGARHGFQRQ
jgi:hypothetical protein